MVDLEEDGGWVATATLLLTVKKEALYLGRAVGRRTAVGLTGENGVGRLEQGRNLCDGASGTYSVRAREANHHRTELILCYSYSKSL